MTLDTLPAYDSAVEPFEKRRTNLLKDNRLEEMWSIFYLSNLFLFPMYARFEEDHEVSRPEFVILYHLHHLGPLIAQEISSLSSLPKNSISRGVKRLIEKDLIKTMPDDRDRRRIPLHITKKGKALLSILLDAAVERRLKMLQPLTPGERTMLKEILLKVALNAHERVEEASSGKPA